MKKYETYDDENLNHVENGPDYGQPYNENNLTWNIENSFEFKYYNKYKSNNFYIEPFIDLSKFK